jgi:uncharacterized protein (DUF1810 family)
MHGAPHELERFVSAQEPVWPQVAAELGAGRKTSHWMWFVFPQLRELGRSNMARRYGIGSLAEAQAYLAHPLLGSRLRHGTQLVLANKDKSIHDIFGSPDDMKFRSCMTLFGVASDHEALFKQALDAFFGGVADQKTLDLLA